MNEMILFEVGFVEILYICGNLKAAYKKRTKLFIFSPPFSCKMPTRKRKKKKKK